MSSGRPLKSSLMILLLSLIIGSLSQEVKAQMPPLYVEVWLPSISKAAPSFPPCECPPDAPICVCQSGGQ